MMTKNLFALFFISIFSSNIICQLADFPFNTDFNDIVTGYVPIAFGTPAIITDGSSQVLQLEGDEYLSLPDALHQAIDINQDVEIQIRFKITDLYDNAAYAGTGEFGENGKRILVSNKSNYIADLGFDISVIEMDEEYRLLMSFGDDSVEGEWIFNDIIESDTWVDLKLIMRLNLETPSIVYKLNGYYRHFPLNIIDADIFKTSLNSQQIWLGTDANNSQGFNGYAFAETSIDYFKIYNPIFVGDTALFTSAINNMTDHVNGTATLTEAQQFAELKTIVDNWDDNIASIFSFDIMDYITAYEMAEGTVFRFYTEEIDLLELSVPRALQFMLIQYSIDNLYTNANVASMNGVSYLDHEIMPGIVSSAATKVNETINIDGDYNTNPGYYLNKQEFVIRPTGYYAAPGDIVDITVPVAIINQDVQIRVGAHAADIRLDYRNFQRFPTLATHFPITNTTVSVANPMGGAIYFLMPDGSNFGSVSINFDNAVKAPYYCSKTGFSNSLSEYQSDLNNAYVNWVDIESNNFMATFPRALAEISPDVSLVLSPLNDIIGTFNVIAGRPLTKIRSEYIISEPQSYTQGTLPASYPMSVVNGDLTEADTYALPVSVLDPMIYMSTYDGSTMIHELGHLHNMPTMYEEGETNIDVPTVMAYNTVFNAPMDTALFYSPGFQFLDRDNGALDWILDPKFRKSLPADFQDVSYQIRGIAKYVDVADLFSWDSLGLIHTYWYDEALSAVEPPTGIAFIPNDDYIEVASDQLGFNFAPLWELWGSIPSQALVDQLDTYPKEDRIKDRILYYRTLVPSNAIEFQNVYNSITPNIEDHQKERYDEMLNYYDESVADSILIRIDDILCKYYDTNCDLTAIDVLLEEDAISLLPNPTSGLFEIKGLLENYTIKLVTPSGAVISNIDCTGYSHFIDLSELPSGLLFVQIINDSNSLVCLKKIIKQ